MYLLPDNRRWDSDYFHTLISDKHIISSSEAKAIREKLTHAGALPHLDNNYDWAVLCIGYCFAKGWARQPENLIAAPDTKGIDIPSFQTCFQDHSRLWLALLSESLFHIRQGKPAGKDDLYKLIADLWHTGALGLQAFWERCRQFKPDDDLAQRQAFLNELAELAVKNSSGRHSTGENSFSDGLHAQNAGTLDAACTKLKTALDKTVGKGGTIQPEYGGVRYDCLRVQFDRYVDLEKYHSQICSELGIGDNEMRCGRIRGEANTWHINILRPQDTWWQYGQDEFQTALQQYRASARQFRLPVCIGLDERGEPMLADLATAVHSFVAGKTGSGKSVFVHSLLHSLLQLNSKEQVEVVILDPKKTEYQTFLQNYPDYIREGRIITDSSEMDEILYELTGEVERRNELLQLEGKRNIAELPEGVVLPRYIVAVVDEVANLLSKNKKVEDLLCQLAEKARSAGIFLLLSTQTPNSESFSQRLRANIPTRIAFSVVNARASEIVLGESGLGAEKLVGSGDHLVKWNGGAAQFLHGYNV